MSDILRTVVILTATALARGYPRACEQAVEQPSLPREGTGAPSWSESDGSAAVQATLPAMVDPKAVAALERMGGFLRTLSVFHVSSDTAHDDVMDDGQRIQVGAHVDMLVEQPNRLRAELTSDRQQRCFFYDGTTFTLWARRENYYATVPAPATLHELEARLESRYGLEMPLADLYYWGDVDHAPNRLVAAVVVGLAPVDGVPCEHYAFRETDLDWQIWIRAGADPLPHKLVTTTTSEPDQSQYTSTMTWNIAPSFSERSFTFEPTDDARRITLAAVSTGRDHESGRPYVTVDRVPQHLS
jgi:hypothetical protein